MSSCLSIILPMLASIAFLLILMDPSLAHKHDNLKKVCSKTDNQDLCVNLMETGLSSSKDIDYKSITKSAIELAYNKATNMYHNLKSLVDDTSKLPLQGLYEECYNGYAYAAEDLEQMSNLFRDGNYKQIEDQVKVVVQQIRYCKEEIENKENDEPHVVKTTKEFGILCDVIKYSAKYWKGGDK